MKPSLMTHRLATNYAKNYCNRTLIVKVIVENVVTCFLGTQCRSNSNVFFRKTNISVDSQTTVKDERSLVKRRMKITNFPYLRTSCAKMPKRLVFILRRSVSHCSPIVLDPFLRYFMSIVSCVQCSAPKLLQCNNTIFAISAEKQNSQR